MRRLTDLTREHRLFSLALGAGALLRLITVIGYPGALWFAGDSYVYIGAALRPQPNLSKVTGYSLFLRAFLPLHSLTVIACLQHLMGLAVGVMVYVLALRAGVSKRWATIGALPVLLDGFEIEDEHMVMAEALFTFLVMAAMLLILWWPRMRWPVAAAAGVLAGYAVIVRSEGLPILLLFPLAIVLRGRRDPRQWLVAGVMLLASLVPVGSYVVWFHNWFGDYNLTTSEGFFLWGRTSSFADCAVIKPPPSLAKVCPSGDPAKRPPPGTYIWHYPPIRYLAGGAASAANNVLLRDFAIRALEDQPLGYVKSVLYDTTLILRFPRVNYPDPGTVWYYYFHLHPLKIPDNPDHEWIKGGTAYHDAVAYGGTPPSDVIYPFAAAIAIYERLVFTYGPLFVVMIGTGLWGVIKHRKSRPRAPSRLPWVTAAVLLMFPIMAADFDYRYLLPVLPFAGLAAALAFAPGKTAEMPEEPANSEPMINA